MRIGFLSKKKVQNEHTVQTIQPTQTVQNEQIAPTPKQPPNLLHTHPIAKGFHRDNLIDMSLINDLKRLQELKDKEFEKFLQKFFESAGFITTLNPQIKKGGDMADLTIKKDGYTYIVEAKGWNRETTWQVGAPPFRSWSV